MDFPIVGNVDPIALVEARTTLQNVVLLIASAGEHLATPQPDDSHRSMGWEPELRAFRGVELKGDFFVRIRAVDYVAEVVTKEKIVGSIEIDGLTLPEALKTLIAFMPVKADFEISIYDDALPDRRLLSDAIVPPPLRECRELALYYARASVDLERLLATEPDARSIRTWPHHFDMATIFPGGPVGSTVGVGFSPGDATYAEPYWYITPSPLQPGATETPLPDRWVWNTEGWTGMVLTSSQMLGPPVKGGPNLAECVQIARNLIQS